MEKLLRLAGLALQHRSGLIMAVRRDALRMSHEVSRSIEVRESQKKIHDYRVSNSFPPNYDALRCRL